MSRASQHDNISIIYRHKYKNGTSVLSGHPQVYINSYDSYMPSLWLEDVTAIVEMPGNGFSGRCECFNPLAVLLCLGSHSTYLYNVIPSVN